jgi:hypothetical protein
MLIQIVVHTPLWVWALLTGLLVLGLVQTRPRRVRPRRLLVLPLAMLALGLWAMAPVFWRQPMVALVWLLSLLLVLRWALRLQPPAGARWRPEAGVLALPGSWMPLCVIVAVFSLRYASGVTMALHPEWRALMAVQLPLALAFGGLSGLFLGRNLVLFKLARPALTQPRDAVAGLVEHGARG